jgi:uncharacterized protein (TIGR02145 family)
MSILDKQLYVNLINLIAMKYFSKIKSVIALISLIGLFMTGCEKGSDDSQNSLNGKTTAVFNSSLSYGTMTDQEGNVYKTITIGTQTWMAENLRTTKYNDGKAIPNVPDSVPWAALTTGAYCNYKNTTDEVFIATYGRLYNRYAVKSGKLAPSGWHVPTMDEYDILSHHLGDGGVAGGKLKEAGITHWNYYDQNVGSTNESGFTALPSGGRLDKYSMSRYMYSDLETKNYLWPVTSLSESSPLCFVLSATDGVSYFTSCNQGSGLSVRLIKD